eukprot:PhF_6_TR41618/c1_g1_i2/m.63078
MLFRNIVRFRPLTSSSSAIVDNPGGGTSPASSPCQQDDHLQSVVTAVTSASEVSILKSLDFAEKRLSAQLTSSTASILAQEVTYEWHLERSTNKILQTMKTDLVALERFLDQRMEHHIRVHALQNSTSATTKSATTIKHGYQQHLYHEHHHYDDTPSLYSTVLAMMVVSFMIGAYFGGSRVEKM